MEGRLPRWRNDGKDTADQITCSQRPQGRSAPPRRCPLGPSRRSAASTSSVSASCSHKMCVPGECDVVGQGGGGSYHDVTA